MLFLYNSGIFLYNLLVKVFSLFNSKAKLFQEGRQNIFSVIESQINRESKHIWFHFASLGEFEQGRPLLERIKADHPDEQIVVTFFSPSGYEIRKNYALAAGVFYLPLDTRKNAERFIELIHPKLAVFTKYEFWHHYYQTLDAQGVPLFLISGIFRSEQHFFKWYGGFYRRMLGHVTHFFVQNEESKALLAGIGIDRVSLAGDTRFDRVFEHTLSAKKFPIVDAFCGDSQVLVAGSTWPADEDILGTFTERHADWKLILAPHEIGESHIQQIQRIFPAAVRYSIWDPTLNSAQVLIIDNIGLLSSLYPYGKLAYIGGGFGAGIHNTLEAAAFGKALLFGPRYDKFQEAKDLINLGAAISVRDAATFELAFSQLSGNQEAGEKAYGYVLKKKGATPTIMAALAPYLH